MSKLARHVKPEIDEARLARQWAAISSREPTRPVPWARIAFATALVGVAFGVYGMTHQRSTQTTVDAPPDPISVESDLGSSAVVFADGSRISGGTGTRLRVEVSTPTLVRVALRSGSADFEVKHDPSRAFVVVAGAVTVVDQGTRFHVEYKQDGGAKVSVSEGSVRVERPGAGPSNLIAGDVWTSELGAPSVDAGPPAISVLDLEKAAPAPSHAPAQDETLTRFEAALATGDSKAAFDVVTASGYPHAIERATSKQLLELGDAARLSGHPFEAAAAYDDLRKRYRQDARAGLAVMELGRLREGALHDPAGAEEAYRDAITLAPDESLREDAEARHVGALEALGDLAACASARDAYLSRYPGGVHEAAVVKRCKGR